MTMRTDPVAYVVVDDAACRARLVDALRRRGWCVIEKPTGFHLLQAIADVIEGHGAELPGLLVVDAFARGCSGLSIAAGLHELGVQIPLVLVGRAGEPLRRLEPLRDANEAGDAGDRGIDELIAALVADSHHVERADAKPVGLQSIEQLAAC
jgi:hypothetical protein